MKVENFKDLNDMHKDVLLELGNIGTGNALTSLSQLTCHPIQMELPSIHITDIDSLPENIDFPGNRNAGVVIDVHGDLDCVITFLLNEQFAKVIAEELSGEQVADLSEMNEMQESSIREVGNIMCNAYLNALASMLESVFSVSLPNLKLGTSKDILDTFLGKFEDETNELLFIENTFFYLDQAFVSYILLHPKFESLRRILEKLT
jgi:Chemotaxis protein CheC, inhibitor of MCP methylation